jgi:uncharacterized membrane protein YeaQ/YmgE (transglycosylase-associated protein family)
MELVNFIISLISGAIGGNVAGSATEKNMGSAANTILGLLGGVGGDFISRALGIFASSGAAAAASNAASSGFDITAALANIGISGVSGAVLTAIITFIRDAMRK